MIQLGAGLTLGVFTIQLHFFSHLRVKKTLIASGVCAPNFLGSIQNFSNLSNLQIGNGSSALCDVIIAASMTYYVRFSFICIFSVYFDL